VAVCAIAVCFAQDAQAAEVRLDARHEPQGAIAPHFVGLSVEWSLIERYMGPNARPAFVNLLRNLGGGVLRIGGSSQDLMPFQPDAPNNIRTITPEDLSFIRSTLDATNEGGSWGVILGTAMAPVSPERPFVSPDHTRSFVRQGVQPAFSGDAAGAVAGIGLGNEPDLSYGKDEIDRYLSDLATFAGDDVTGPEPIVAPSTSEDIVPWTSIDPTRYFRDWPRILDTVAERIQARAGPFGAFVSDHFYPLARTCPNDPYRCPTIPALLSAEHMATLDYQVYRHAGDAAAHGVGYRLDETNTAAGRGADGVSNVAASATWALEMMFHAACPQPPSAPSANVTCGIGAVGANFHNAEVRAFFFPEEGNAYYNPIDYDPSEAIGPPTAKPEYYAMLLFASFAQGMDGLRPVPVTGAPEVSAWRLEGSGSERRLFLINKGDRPQTVVAAVPGRWARVNRMTPHDPTGAGRTLDAAEVRIDGTQVAPDGSWPGFHPEAKRVERHHLTLDLVPGEAAVVSVLGRG
jgi:hypothetical protein